MKACWQALQVIEPRWSQFPGALDGLVSVASAAWTFFKWDLSSLKPKKLTSKPSKDSGQNLHLVTAFQCDKACRVLSYLRANPFEAYSHHRTGHLNGR